MGGDTLSDGRRAQGLMSLLLLLLRSLIVPCALLISRDGTKMERLSEPSVNLPLQRSLIDLWRKKYKKCIFVQKMKSLCKAR